MYSDTTHQLNGKPATATLMEHIKTCTVEYQRVGQEPRKDPMACDAAEQFQRLIGSNKIKVSHEFLARVQFPLENGRRHEAKVEENKLEFTPAARSARNWLSSMPRAIRPTFGP